MIDTSQLTPLVSILILNWNRLDDTIKSIESASNQCYNNTEIVVIDNGSTDDSALILINLYKNDEKVKITQLDENYGCPEGRNIGVNYCNGDYIFFCDNDGLLHRNAVSNAMKIIIQNKKIGIVSGKIIEFSDYNEVNINKTIENLSCEYRISNNFKGGVSLIKKGIFNNVSKYPNIYFYGGEETYLSYRTIDAGLIIVHSDNVVLWHRKSQNARNNKINNLRILNNSLYNAYQLFPLIFLILFIIYYFSVYNLYAIKMGIFIKFLLSHSKNFFALRTLKRNPVKYSTFFYMTKKI